jgi:hypothetical protein
MECDLFQQHFTFLPYYNVVAFDGVGAMVVAAWRQHLLRQVWQDAHE